MAAAAAETFLTGLSDTSEDDRLIRTSYNFYYFHERARGWLRWRELCAHIVQMREIISSLPALDDVRLIRALRAWMETARARARHLELMTRALDHLAGEGKGDERGGGLGQSRPTRGRVYTPDGNELAAGSMPRLSSNPIPSLLSTSANHGSNVTRLPPDLAHIHIWNCLWNSAIPHESHLCGTLSR